MSESTDAARAPVTIRIVRYYLPVAAMLAVMYYFSTDVFSADNTRNVIEKIFLWFVPHASKHAMATLNYVVRKSAHFTEYAMLGAFLFRAFRADDPMRWRLRWSVYSFVTAGSWALLDEFHQVRKGAGPAILQFESFDPTKPDSTRRAASRSTIKATPM